MYFIIQKEIQDVEKFIDAHIQFLDTWYKNKKFIFSRRKNPRNGGVILAYKLDKKELMEIIKQDPFYQNEIADYEITEFIPTKYDENFAPFMD